MAPARIVLLLLVVIALVLVVLVMSPFASAFLLAAVLAGAFHPWFEKLAARVRGRRHLAAGILTALVCVLLVIPVGALGVYAVKEAVEALTYVRTTLRFEGPSGLADKLPEPLQPLGEKLLKEVPRREDEQLEALAKEGGSRIATLIQNLLQAAGRAVLLTVLMLIALHFLLVDGHLLVDWANDVVPLRRVQIRELLREFRRVSVAVLFSSLATSGVQSIAALVGYLLAKVPNAVFFTLLTFFVGLIPALGAASVSLLLALLLFLGGHPIAAGFLAIWGVVVVGLVDNIVKPLLIKGEVELHGAVVFFALLGGLAIFGAVGLLAGPLIVAFFLAVVRMCKREFEDEPVGELITPR